MIGRTIGLCLFTFVGGAATTDDPASRPRLAKEGRAVELALSQASLDRLAKTPPSKEAWEAGFAVRMADSEINMLGRREIVDGALRFVPRFAFQPGARLIARFNPTALGLHDSEGVMEEEIILPARPLGQIPRIEMVAPSSDVVPENLLRIYLHFTSPMARGEAYRSLRLFDESGKVVEGAFLELGEELWDPTGRRLTLLLDPGRIKRGLLPREEMGPILVAGQTYTLVVTPSWQDAQGVPLGREFRRTFRAGPEDTYPPNPDEWTIKPPRAGTSDPLSVVFDAPLDLALAQRLIHVRRPGGKNREGLISVERGETEWNFNPAEPWECGAHELIVGTELEDPAGNNVRGRFEVDVFERVEPSIQADTVTRAFRID